jgi:hypothetical protein
METRSKYVVRCLASGIIVLMLFALLTFWLRWFYAYGLADTDASRRPNEVRLPLTSIMPEEIESDPNVAVHAQLRAQVYAYHDIQTLTLGISETVSDIEDINPDVYQWQPGKPDKPWVYFDRRLGLIVYSWVQAATDMNEPGPGRRTWWYAGPDGMAPTVHASLGRFESPVISRHSPLLVYDGNRHRFFAVNLHKRQVVQGPEPDPNKPLDPVRIEWSGGQTRFFSMYPEGPTRQLPEGQTPISGRAFDGRRLAVITSGGDSYALVFDASGRIDLLDPRDLTIVGPAGYLPVFEGPFDSTEQPGPLGLLAYGAMPLWLIKTSETPPEYIGCAVGAINRDGSEFLVRVFDDKGLLKRAASQRILASSALTGARYTFESLQPPLLSMLSEITAPYIGARAGTRGLLVLPNSLVAMRGRTSDTFYVTTILAGLGLISPSLALAVILAWLVARDGRLLGLSKDARTLWVLAITVLGIPAGVTYLLTRPRTTRVTCKNCGKLRRPDMERCHHCGSLWDIPELNAPTWRVFDGAEAATHNNAEELQNETERQTDSSVKNE